MYETNQTSSPDVAYNADPASGVSVYDSTRDSSGAAGWQVFGGTSAGSPQWAALVTLVDQGRALNGQGSLESQASLKALYAASASDFHDIVSGSNGYAAGPGYDLATGRGSPVANLLVLDLAGYGSTSSGGGSTGGTTGDGGTGGGTTTGTGGGTGTQGGYGYGHGHGHHPWWVGRWTKSAAAICRSARQFPGHLGWTGSFRNSLA
jgi:hypothetical protein